MFDVIVIGAGHAGLEAAFAASRFKIKVALITMPGVGIASAPCNPCVGGVGKGQVVRELDALGGVMPFISDRAGIQFRTLNESKGYAVQSTRVQIDKDLYSEIATDLVKNNKHIELIESKVSTITFEDEFYTIKASTGESFETRKLILTVGTFLNGKLHTGESVTVGGRESCESAASLDELFSKIKKRPMRFKTGTPPRILTESVNFDACEIQPSDKETNHFHWAHIDKKRFVEQVSCYVTRTNQATMDHIRDNKEKSPLFNGQIKAIGARYCPSIEDKAFRYPDKNIHHVFIEPEGHKRDTVYPSGISSSLPAEIQEDYVKTIPGLENAIIKTYGYAVEYDVIDTTELKLSLEHTMFPGLFFAGQVNGTSGYEEAAGQGFIAGINAAFALLGRGIFTISRNDSYIGVMIEDLVTNTRDEPYRLFTARSENRLYVREDNAVIRMYPYRKTLFLQEEVDFYQDLFVSHYKTLSELLDSTYINPDECPYRDIEGISSINKRMNLSELLKQSWLDPIKTLEHLLKAFGLTYPRELVNCLAISKKYEGYINRANSQLDRMRNLDSKRINWEGLCESKNISFECKQRITKIRPETFGQLRQIEGIRPATLAVVAGGAL